MSLAKYRTKRDFSRTPEPAGVEAPRSDPPRFVIQRHRARRLHYDFRLEVGGVLASWAVPKGLTLDPAARRLAVHVEDHPIEYESFEGVIPGGEYGSGDVIVWDRGTWELHGTEDASAAIDAGELHAELFGEKIRGRIVLVRTKGDRGGGGGKDNWILLHKRDEHAVDGWDPEDHPRSVLSGRTNDEVAANPDRLWTREEGELPARPSRPEFAAATTEELSELDALPEKARWTVHGRAIALTNLDKVLFGPRDDDGPVTKRDLVRYFTSIAPTLLPYLEGRPLNLHRFPNGCDTNGFWQKQVPSHAPDWVTRWDNPEADRGESGQHLVADSTPTLAWLANHAAIELHPWTSRIPDVHHPTYALIDLDPGTDTSWDDLLVLARLHRTALEHLRVRGYPKVTGRRGIQIWIPIAEGPTFAETRAWVEQVSHAVGDTAPDLVSWKWNTRSREGRARLDYTQNAVNKTLVAPYSPRPAAGAPVSMPITWDELDDPDLRPDRWTIRTARSRLEGRPDPMAAVLTDTQRLPALT
ncbi:MAG: non-homologous end-joining DNA ligase [Acidimicrobiia bacterium]